MAGLAVPFEANQGQFAPEVAFAARTFAGTLFVTQDGQVVHALAGKPAKVAEEKPGEVKRTAPTPRGPGWALVESLQGAGKLAPVGSQPSATRVSRFTAGAAPNKTSRMAAFNRVRLGEAWPGVSVELAARGSNVEKLFTVAPGTNPKTIQMGVAGAKRLRLGKDGSLIAVTGNGDVAFTSPVAFQDIDGQRTEVPVKYRLLADNSYRFETGIYDRSEPLVIDPLLQATYLGGSGGEVVNALAIDGSGNVLVAGTTSSTSDFPGTTGGAQPVFGGSQDAFVARLSNNLTTLMQATYLGGSTYDSAYALALDASGNVLVAGETESTNFPGTIGGAQPTNSSAGIGGGTVSDAFVARLSSNLTTLVQATYLGGAGNDEAHALALDAGGNVYVAGITSAVDFPGTSGGAQPTNSSAGVASDAFVARLSNNLTTLVQATYLGGSGNGFERANALAFDANGNVLVAGITSSAHFPGTTGGAQATFGGPQPMFGSGSDAFVALLSGNLATLMQATYLGGGGNDGANALVLDTGGNVLVVGSTASTNFSSTAGGAQPGNGGGSADAFVARLSSNLTTIMQATYVGGSGSDGANALALDTAGNVLVAGYTSSTNFPSTSGGAQPANGGGNDAFVARLSSNLTTLVQATYLGGSGTFSEQATALALDTGDNVLVAGGTDSSNFPGTIGGAQPASGGGFGTDGFVAKLTSDLKVSNDRVFANSFE